MKISINELYVIIYGNGTIYPKIFTSKEVADKFNVTLEGEVYKVFINDNTDQNTIPSMIRNCFDINQ